MSADQDYEPSPFDWVREQVELYESSGGTEGTTLRDTGYPVVLLTLRGAKSGKIRKTPLMRVEHDGRYAAVASMGGAPTHPVWYRNIVAHPRLELQDGVDALHFEPRQGKRLPLGISIGAAIFPHDGTSYETLLATADSRMYRDKSRRKRGSAAPAAPTIEPPVTTPDGLSDAEVRRAAVGIL